MRKKEPDKQRELIRYLGLPLGVTQVAEILSTDPLSIRRWIRSFSRRCAQLDPSGDWLAGSDWGAPGSKNAMRAMRTTAIEVRRRRAGNVRLLQTDFFDVASGRRPELHARDRAANATYQLARAHDLNFRTTVKLRRESVTARSRQEIAIATA
ncbi:conserved hypothetical protein [Ricinus communis]|uniref:DUF746 domain-containing protein n=1 Tax=Ricinus communis TaxID=3988 RepID=B9TBN6_RICCO|nr:conserved hypothetical protein [Ricinus communis]